MHQLLEFLIKCGRWYASIQQQYLGHWLVLEILQAPNMIYHSESFRTEIKKELVSIPL